MRFLAPSFILVSTLLLPACGREKIPTALAVDSHPSYAIWDAVRGGKPGVYWLPPLVKNPVTSGIATGVFLSQARVLVCDLGTSAPSSSSVCGVSVAEFTSVASNGGAALTYDAASGQYQVDFDTKSAASGSGLLLDHFYRIQLWLGGPVLVAYADLDPVTGSELKNATTGDLIPLVNGRTLPIKFRLETSAAAVVGSAGGSVSALNGNVGIVFPAGAIGSDIAVIVTAAALDPPDATVVPGSTVSLEPSPITFSVPVTLTLKYDPASIPGGLANESNLAVVKADGAGWNEVAGSAVNSSTHSVSAPLNGFSKYGVGLKKIRHALFRGQGGGLYLGDVGGITPVQIATLYGMQQYVWSPDFTKIAIAYQNQVAPYDSFVQVMNADGSGATKLSLASGVYYKLAWTSDGQRLVMACSAQFANAGICSVSALDGSGYVQVVPPPADGSQISPLGVTNAGRVLYRKDGSSNQGLWTVNLDGTNPVQLLSTTYGFYIYAPALSPDRSQLAFSGSDLGNGLCTIKIDGSVPYRCIPGAEANNGDDGTSVAWSPDGTKIAYTHYVSGVGGFVRVATVASEQISGDLIKGFAPGWSANGSWISFSTVESGIAVLYAMHPDGTGVTPMSLYPVGGATATWRP